LNKLNKQAIKKTKVTQKNFASNPIAPQPEFTRKAVELFEKQTDIKKFTDIVMQGEITSEFLNNTDAELLLKDVFNPFNEESYKKLAENERLLKDLTTDIN